MQNEFYKLWSKLQEEELKSGTFSVKSLGAIVTGGLLNDYLANMSCLDVGCGILKLPYYMKIATAVNFTGIDPNRGGKRLFNFRQGMGEQLPFDDDSFDGVLFATSLDHMIRPHDSIKEGYRVLREGGYMFVWNRIVKDDIKYRQWNTGTQYDARHLWGFTIYDMRKMFTGIKREINLLPNQQGVIFIIQKYGVL